MDYILDLLLKQIFGQPFLLLAIVVFIGYIAMKQTVGKAIIGAFKASIGILVMGMGSGALITNFGKLLTALQNATGIQGAGLNTYPTMTASYEKMDAILGEGTGATWGIYVLLVAFLMNLVLVALRKWTKIRAVYLTGNAMIVQCGISTYIVWRFLGTGMIATVLIASLVTALYWGICSTALIKPTKVITGGADLTVAHQQMFMSFVAYKVAPKLGNPEDDIEKKKMPKSLNFLQDSVLATLLVMLISTAIIMLVIGKDGVDWLRSADGFNQGGYKNFVVFLLWISITLTANIWVLLAGVRMFVGELMMSFKGISEKLLPGAVAGVDCAAIFGFAPKSVVLGLICGAVGQILGLILLLVFKSPIFLVPGFIPLFFDNATVAIFANKFGGYKAAAGICIANGLIQIMGSMLAVSMMELTWWQGSADYATVWVGIIAIFKLIGSALGIPVAG
ncbi:PTS transporter subunit IIC [Candidatus Merdisoma sp. JLR.KK006]|jgi:PTS system ascorbate-specific IIC component|uniref:PTS transporter subunit IIC n=1 Tax=Candidatus Merdisoma sp. JLR.KK006 TaxID=3112626 RepID=UPI002FF33ED0